MILPCFRGLAAKLAERVMPGHALLFPRTTFPSRHQQWRDRSAGAAAVISSPPNAASASSSARPYGIFRLWAATASPRASSASPVCSSSGRATVSSEGSSIPGGAKTVVVVESPTKAKKIQSFLGADYQVKKSPETKLHEGKLALQRGIIHSSG